MPDKILFDTFDIVALLNCYNPAHPAHSSLALNRRFFQQLKQLPIQFCLSKGSVYELSDKKYAAEAGRVRLIHDELRIADLPPTWDLFLKTKEDKQDFSARFLHRAMDNLWADLKKEEFFHQCFRHTFNDLDPALVQHYEAILSRDGLPPAHTLKSLDEPSYRKYRAALAEAFAHDVDIRDKHIALPKLPAMLTAGDRPRRDSSSLAYVSSYGRPTTLPIVEFTKRCGKFAYVRYCAGMHLALVDPSVTIAPTIALQGNQFKPILDKKHYLDFDSDLKSRLLCLYAIKMQTHKNVEKTDRNTQVDGTRLMHLPDVATMSVDMRLWNAITSCGVLPPALSDRLLPTGYLWCHLIKKYQVPDTLWPSFLDPTALRAYLAGSPDRFAKSAYVQGTTRL